MSIKTICAKQNETKKAVIEGYRKDLIEQLRTAENRISLAIEKMYAAELKPSDVEAVLQAIGMAQISAKSVYWKVKNVEPAE